MSIDFEIPTETIAVGKGSFTVRGMNTEDLTFLSVNYLDDMRSTVAKYADRGAVQQDKLAELAMDLAKDFPAMVTEIISRCAEAQTAEDVMKIRALAFPKQLEALRKIAILTAQDSGIELGNAARGLASLLEAASREPGPLTTSLRTIIAGYANPSASSGPTGTPSPTATR